MADLEMGEHQQDLTAAEVTMIVTRIGGAIGAVEDILKLIDSYRYEADWRSDYRYKGLAEALGGATLTCLDAAVVACALLKQTSCRERGLLAIHRRDALGEECGHVAAVYRHPETGRWGSISKSSFPFLPNLPPTFHDCSQIALRYARGYRAHGIRPLYFGVHLDGVEIAFDDHLGDAAGVERLCDHILGSYQYEFQVSAAP